MFLLACSSFDVLFFCRFLSLCFPNLSSPSVLFFFLFFLLVFYFSLFFSPFSSSSLFFFASTTFYIPYLSLCSMYANRRHSFVRLYHDCLTTLLHLLSESGLHLHMNLISINLQIKHQQSTKHSGISTQQTHETEMMKYRLITN